MPSYVAFTRDEFELKLGTIANVRDLKVREVAKKGVYERMYDLTTANPAIHILIYSTLATDDEARDAGADAVRVQLWIKTEEGTKFKNFKTHYRTAGFFENLAKTVDEIQEYVNSKEAGKWLWVANKVARENVRAEAAKNEIDLKKTVF